MKIARDDVYSAELKSEDGKLESSCTGKVQPLSWMIPGSKLRLDVTLANGSSGFVESKSILCENASKQDVINLIETLRLCPCLECGQPAIEPSFADAYLKGLCQPCHRAKREALLEGLCAEIERLQKEEAAEQKALEEAYKAQGYTHRLEACVESEFSDEELRVSIWMVNPDANRVDEELRNLHCTHEENYRLIEL